MNSQQQPAKSTQAKQPKLMFPTLTKWREFVAKQKTTDQLNEAMKLLQGAKKSPGIHSFIQDGKMGLAVWILDKQAIANLHYRARNNSYYPENIVNNEHP